MIFPDCSAVVAVADFVEFLDFFLSERLLVAEQVGDERDFCEVLDCFHPHVSAF